MAAVQIKVVCLCLPTVSALPPSASAGKQTRALTSPTNTQRVPLSAVRQRVRVGLMLHKWREAVEYVWMEGSVWVCWCADCRLCLAPVLISLDSNTHASLSLPAVPRSQSVVFLHRCSVSICLLTSNFWLLFTRVKETETFSRSPVGKFVQKLTALSVFDILTEKTLQFRLMWEGVCELLVVLCQHFLLETKQRAWVQWLICTREYGISMTQISQLSAGRSSLCRERKVFKLSAALFSNHMLPVLQTDWHILSCWNKEVWCLNTLHL